MSEIANVVPGEPVESAWGNQIRDRSITRYPDATARDASILAPVNGVHAWLSTPIELTVYDGAAWRRYAFSSELTSGLAGKVSKGGDSMSGPLDMTTQNIVWSTDAGAVIGAANNNGLRISGTNRIDLRPSGNQRLTLRSTFAIFGPDSGAGAWPRLTLGGAGPSSPMYSNRDAPAAGVNVTGSEVTVSVTSEASVLSVVAGRIQSDTARIRIRGTAAQRFEYTAPDTTTPTHDAVWRRNAIDGIYSLGVASFLADSDPIVSAFSSAPDLTLRELVAEAIAAIVDLDTRVTTLGG